VDAIDSRLDSALADIDSGDAVTPAVGAGRSDCPTAGDAGVRSRRCGHANAVIARGGELAAVARGGELAVVARGGELAAVARGGELAAVARGGELAVVARGGELAAVARGGELAVVARGGELAVVARGGRIRLECKSVIAQPHQVRNAVADDLREVDLRADRDSCCRDFRVVIV